MNIIESNNVIAVSVDTVNHIFKTFNITDLIKNYNDSHLFYTVSKQDYNEILDYIDNLRLQINRKNKAFIPNVTKLTENDEKQLAKFLEDRLKPKTIKQAENLKLLEMIKQEFNKMYEDQDIHQDINLINNFINKILNDNPDLIFKNMIVKSNKKPFRISLNFIYKNTHSCIIHLVKANLNFDLTFSSIGWNYIDKKQYSVKLNPFKKVKNKKGFLTVTDMEVFNNNLIKVSKDLKDNYNSGVLNKDLSFLSTTMEKLFYIGRKGDTIIKI